MGLRNPVECSKTRCLGYSRQVPLFMNARCWISYDDDPDEYMRKKELAKKKAGLKKERTKMKNVHDHELTIPFQIFKLIQFFFF